MYEDGQRIFKPSMEKIKNNLKGKDYIAVVKDVSKRMLNIIHLEMATGCPKWSIWDLSS